MTLQSPHRKATARPAPALPPAPHPWPVDPKLSSRVSEVRSQIARTRRQLALHVLPEREGRPGTS